MNPPWLTEQLNIISQAGGIVTIPRGRFEISDTILIDHTNIVDDADNRRVSLVGDGSGCSELRWIGPANTPMIKVQGGTVGASMHVMMRLEGLKLTSETPGNGVGVHIDKAAFFEVHDVHSQSFDTHWKLTDTLSARFYSCRTAWGRNAINAKRVSFSSPNALSFHGCTVGHASEWGMVVEGGASLSFIGGSIEQCGAGGVALMSPGVEGGVAVNLQTYFEGNKGIADIYVFAGPNPAVVNAAGCTFNRLPGNAPNCIRLDAPAGAAEITINTAGSSFRHFNGYQPTAATPYYGLNVNGPFRLVDVGAYYASDIERPWQPSSIPFANAAFTGAGGLFKSTNVRTLTRLGVGDYQIGFWRPGRAPFMLQATADGGQVQLFTETSSSIRVRTLNGGALFDPPRVGVIVFD